MSVLTVVLAQDGDVKRMSLETLARGRDVAQKAGTAHHAVVVDADPARISGQLAGLGVSTLFGVTMPAGEALLARPFCEAIEAAARKADAQLVLMPSAEATKEVLGALAVRLDATAVPDVSAFEWTSEGVEAVRPVMTAKFNSTIKARGERFVVTVRSGTVTTESNAEGHSPDVVHVSLDGNDASVAQDARLKELISAISDTVDLNEARVVIAAGRGVEHEAAKQLILDLADVMGGAVGASRGTVLSGMFPHTALVGQTGRVVTPDVYVAIGISGAVQHLAGMSGSKIIVAINKDANAPIFEHATYGLVGDLNDILPPLIDALRRIAEPA